MAKQITKVVLTIEQGTKITDGKEITGTFVSHEVFDETGEAVDVAQEYENPEFDFLTVPFHIGSTALHAVNEEFLSLQDKNIGTVQLSSDVQPVEA